MFSSWKGPPSSELRVGTWQRLKSVQWLSIHEGLSQGLQIDMRAEFVSIVVWNKEARACPASYMVGAVEKDNCERCHTPFHTCFGGVKSPAFHFTTSVQCFYLSAGCVLCIHSWYRVNSNINPFNERTANRQCMLATSLGPNCSTTLFVYNYKHY